MCGIIGTSNSEISIEKFKLAHQTIYQRGPDNQSVLASDDFVFGHSRLSIIDLDERSNQPFNYTFQSKKITIVFNGEIYNFLEIKKELSFKGYVFNTTSDTEVVCASYLEWGYQCFDYFQGMWALSLFDHSKKEMVISRDRVGKKPFYYSFNNGVLNFASSLWGVAILTDSYSISTKGLQLYFALGFIPDNFSIINGIEKLAPGKIIVFQKKNNTTLDIKEELHSTLKNKDNSSSIPQLINAAVKNRIISDVPIATLMSGGVDSTIITKLTQSINQETKAYFVDFDDEKLSEFYWANYLSQRNTIHLDRVFLKEIDLDNAFTNYAQVYEEPFADYSGIPSIAIFKKVAQNYKVVLTGDGGDELFYGYPHYFKKVLLFTLLKLNSIFKFGSFFSKNIQLIINGEKDNFEGNYLKNHAVVTPFAFNYINARFNSVLSSTNSFSKAIIQYDREFNNLPEKYLVKTDRASMFSGIEVRSPFLDEVLLNKVKRTSVWKIFTPKLSKLYLKVIYFKMFGLKYFFAKKQGFVPPIKALREKYFAENDFIILKLWLKNNDIVFFNEINELTFDELKKDPILFDRFFFFDIWLKNSEFKNLSTKV
jgi:asparagine synthase (glutamine-hydrolysing)